jgi:hypothetical protein
MLVRTSGMGSFTGGIWYTKAAKDQANDRLWGEVA